MLALPIKITAISDVGTTGQPAAEPSGAEGFLALLNAGDGTNDMWGNSVVSNNNGNNNNIATTQTSVPTSLFAASNFKQDNQNANTPAPQPQQQQESAPASANNQTQNVSPPLPPAPPQQQQQQQSSSSSNNNNQNTSASASSQQAQDQTNSGNTSQPAKQLTKQIQDQLDNISQMLLSMIQALSGNASQPITTNAVATSSSQVATAGNDTTGSAGSGQTASPTDQEIGLLKDMQSLLQQLQQSLSGQEQTGQQVNIQTISNTLLADMAKLAQLAGQSSDGTTTNSLLDSTQFGNLSNLIKNSIAQAQNQLQVLQTSNEALFAQVKASLQSQTDTNNSPKTTQDNNNNSATTTAAANTISIAPVAQDVTVKPVNNLFPTAVPVALANTSQDGNNSANNSNQDSSQNQSTQPVVAAAASSSPTATSSASFAKTLNQVSQGSVLNQVAVQIKTAVDTGSSKITIQLNPPDLGKLDVKLNISADGKASNITIVASNNDTLNLLKQDTHGLTRALNDAGLTTDSGSLNFSLGGGGQQQSQDSQQAASSYQQAQPEEEEPTAITTISRNYVVTMTDGLDITI